MELPTGARSRCRRGRGLHGGERGGPCAGCGGLARHGAAGEGVVAQGENRRGYRMASGFVMATTSARRSRAVATASRASASLTGGASV